MKFRLNSFKGCQVTERTRNGIANDQRYKAELWFLFITHRLIVLYNCMKFNLYSLMVVNLQSGHEIALQMIKGK